MSDPFLDLLGPNGWREAPDAIAPFERDWLDAYGARPAGVALPASTAEVAAVMRLCAERGLSITPQGGNTGLNGGSVLSEGETGIILSLSRMNRIEHIDPLEMTASVQAGVVLANLHEAVADYDLMLPLHLGAEGTAQIGGLVSTNAGGSLAMRYGMMEAQVLGLEVVLPDGSIWDGMRALIKDNSGLALRKLFCGAEGRLGVVTRAILRLQPAPTAHATALLALPDMEAAVRVGALLRRRAGDFLAAMEFFCETGLEMLLRNVPELARPMAGIGPTYLLAEMATSVTSLDLHELFEAVLGEAMESGDVTDGVIANSAGQRAALWQLREEMPEGQKREGVQIKHDVAAPVGRLAEFIATVSESASHILPGVRINPFGHLGDGNIHLNLSPPSGEANFGGKAEALSEAIYDIAQKLGGTFSAEHGLGQAKPAIADRLRSTTERALMAKLIDAVDPARRMNPGKIV